MTTQINEQTLIEIGTLWEKGNNRRVYFNDLVQFTGISVTRYGSGSISSATRDGSKISNKLAGELLNTLRRANVYYDLNSGEFITSGLSAAMADEIISTITARATAATAQA